VPVGVAGVVGGGGGVVGGVGQGGKGGTAVKLLFLDIDGVLNVHESDPEVAILNYVLRRTDARLVLSSAWRYLVHRGEMNLAGLDWLLRSHGVLAGRLVGITRPDTMRDRMDYDGRPGTWPQVDERGQQIADYIRNDVFDAPEFTMLDGYAVVDDLDLGIREAGHPFVQTDGAVGLTGADAERLVELLGRA
jgi:hypothetical protein